MVPRLQNFLQSQIPDYRLVDGAVSPGPEPQNSWAVYCAWVIDWAVAYLGATVALGAWEEFIAPLGFSVLGPEGQQLLQSHGHRLRLLMTPLLFFGLTVLSLLLHRRTLGLRVFNHRLSSQGSVLLYAAGATVAVGLGGVPVLFGLCDRLANTETISDQFSYWRFALSHPVPETPLEVNLVDDLERVDSSAPELAA